MMYRSRSGRCFIFPLSPGLEIMRTTPTRWFSSNVVTLVRLIFLSPSAGWDRDAACRSEHDHAGQAVLVHRIDSVDVHASGLDDLGPELRIGLDARLGVDTPSPVEQNVLGVKSLLNGRRRQRLLHLGFEECSHGIRKAGRCSKDVIALILEVRVAGFGNRRQFRREQRARTARHREAFQSARADVLQYAWNRYEAELDLTCGEVRCQLGVAAIWYRHCLEAGQKAEIFHAQVAGAARAASRVVDRLLFRIGNKFGYRVDRDG